MGYLGLQISRLIEMQTPLYLERARQVHPSFPRQGPALASNWTVSQSAPSVWVDKHHCAICNIHFFFRFITCELDSCGQARNNVREPRATEIAVNATGKAMVMLLSDSAQCCRMWHETRCCFHQFKNKKKKKCSCRGHRHCWLLCSLPPAHFLIDWRQTENNASAIQGTTSHYSCFSWSPKGCKPRETEVARLLLSLWVTLWPFGLFSPPLKTASLRFLKISYRFSRLSDPNMLQWLSVQNSNTKNWYVSGNTLSLHSDLDWRSLSLATCDS